MEESTQLQVQIHGGGLRPPSQKEARQFRQDQRLWVQQVQLEPRSWWSLDTLERGEVIEMEDMQSRGRRRSQEGLREFQRFEWTFVIWLGWIFGIIRNWWRN